MLQGCQVTDHEDFRMTGQAQVCLHQHTAGTIHRATQSAAQRGSGDSCGPQNDGGVDDFVAQADFARTHVGYRGIQAHVHT